MNKMMAITISAGATTLRAVGDRVAAETGADHAAADGDQDQEEGAQQLRKQAPSLVPVVPEVELAGHRVRLPHGPQGHLGMTDSPLPFRPGWRDYPARLAGHPYLISGPRDFRPRVPEPPFRDTTAPGPSRHGRPYGIDCGSSMTNEPAVVSIRRPAPLAPIGLKQRRGVRLSYAAVHSADRADHCHGGRLHIHSRAKSRQDQHLRPGCNQELPVLRNPAHPPHLGTGRIPAADDAHALRNR